MNQVSSNLTSGIFVTGIDTNIGKTVTAATLALTLKWDYWKPVQSGDLDQSDSMRVSHLVSEKVNTWPEAYRLKTPASPDWAAELDGIEIKLETINRPTSNRLVVEGAGGLLVPLNSRQTILDLIEKLGLPVLLVTKHYLGSINHTLLSIEVLKSRRISILGIVVNGDRNKASESSIERLSGLSIIADLPTFTSVTPDRITSQATQWQKSGVFSHIREKAANE